MRNYPNTLKRKLLDTIQESPRKERQKSIEKTQAVHGWLSTYERLVNSQKFFSPYLTQEDMSRLGRDYLQVGYYTDSYFPDHSIRFIAINDCVDSDDGENELAPFRNVMNEMYARDISRKVRSSHRLRGNAGEPLAQPPYGYKKSPENKKWWIIDPEAAAVVRDIFAMAMEGKGNETIAGILQARKVLIPMAYWREKGLPRGGKVSQPDPYKWCKSTVEKILRQQEYCGDIVNFKTYSKSFKNKVRIPNPEENWAVFKNVHEPIIEREVWEQVQQHMQRMPAHMQMWLPPPAFGDGSPPVPVAGISAASV